MELSALLKDNFAALCAVLTHLFRLLVVGAVAVRVSVVAGLLIVGHRAPHMVYLRALGVGVLAAIHHQRW